MLGKIESLEDDVFAAFERACCEHDLKVADYLLQALEAMAERSGDEAQLEVAYLRFGQRER